MKANESKLQPVLEGVKQYVVPLFQRSYSWKKKHWQTLWGDILGIYDANDNNLEHFIGTIVTMPIDMSPEGINKFLLIDGQQRLTTFFIILAAMRDIAINKDKRFAQQLEDIYLINKWENDINQMKLLPSQPDRETFFQTIKGESQTVVNNGIYKAYAFFKRKLSGKDSNGKAIDINRVHKLLMQHFVIVSIVLHRDENPYLIFESLNAKGEPLTQADLVRNYILMRIKNTSDQEIAYRDFWLPMQRSLDNELTDFLWSYLTKDGTFLSRKGIYSAVKRRLAKKDSNGVVDVLMEMDTYSKYYIRLTNPDQEPNQKIRQRLLRINRWQIKTSYPFLLNIFHDYHKKQITDSEFCKILDMIEAFVIRRFFCRIPTNALNKLFIALYNSIGKEKLIENLEIELLRQKWPSDTKFLDAFERFPLYSSGREKCRLVLESLESALLDNNEPVDMTYHQITIEHIMPQTLNEFWETTLGENAATIHSTYLHTIGNLTLTGQNSPMGNLPFHKKSNTLKKSNFELNKRLSNLASAWWSEENIKQRAHDLGKIAIKIWEHPGIEVVSQDRQYMENDPTGHKPEKFVLFEEEYKVVTWREMLLTTLKLLAEKHGDEFRTRAIEVKTNRRVHISESPDGLIAPKRIEGTDLWVEVNQSSRSVLWIINQIMEIFGYAEDDFKAFW